MEKLEKGMPTLGKIYKEWRKEWEERRLLEMTSSDEEDDAATKREKMLARKEKVEKQKNKAKDDATSSSGSSSSGSSSSMDSDVEMQDAPPSKEISQSRRRSHHLDRLPLLQQALIAMPMTRRRYPQQKP